MKSSNYIKPTLLIMLVLFFACTREYDNPWDGKADSNTWAPQNLQIESISITEKKLTWTYSDENIEGFKLDRKKGNEEWQVAYKTINKEARAWIDTDIVPDPELTYSYRLYAYLGEYNSSYAENNFNANIPAPTNLEITTNSITSVTLTWQDNSTGEEGFKIDRKINQGTWEVEFATLNANQISFNDDGVDLENNVYTYRVYAFVNTYQSQKIEGISTLPCGYPFTDSRDGNQYETGGIGNQCWMKQNLAYLPDVSPPSNGSQTSSYHYVYGYDGSSVSEAKETSNFQDYGVLYNWPAALTACPDGWHLPSDDEWTILTNFLGGQSVAGGKMKSTRTEPDPHPRWNSPNTGATNESGFSGLPGGYRSGSGNFSSVGNLGYWWSSTEYSSTNAWLRYLIHDNVNADRLSSNKEYGFSVRCLRD